jgi:hypothetical protein
MNKKIKERKKERKYRRYMQWSFIQPERMKLLFSGKGMELENFHVKQSTSGLKKSKVTCFPSYVEAKPVS